MVRNFVLEYLENIATLAELEIVRNLLAQRIDVLQKQINDLERG